MLMHHILIISRSIACYQALSYFIAAKSLIHMHMPGVATSGTWIDALLNFDQEIIRNVGHKTLCTPRGCRTSSTPTQS